MALLEKDVRHPLAEIIYKEALNRSKIAGTNFSFIVIEKEYVPSLGIKARVLNKQTQKEHTILIGNQKLLVDSGINLSDFKKEK